MLHTYFGDETVIPRAITLGQKKKKKKATQFCGPKLNENVYKIIIAATCSRI